MLTATVLMSSCDEGVDAGEGKLPKYSPTTTPISTPTPEAYAYAGADEGPVFL